MIPAFSTVINWSPRLLALAGYAVASTVSCLLSLDGRRLR